MADGAFAALLAARSAAPDQPGVLAPGRSPAFLAPQPVDTLALVLDRLDLIDVWRRLGLRTLAHLASLEAGDVLARFATDGVVAHRLASGLDPHPARRRAVPPRSSLVAAELDPPAERVDTAAFLAKSLADTLHERLAIVAWPAPGW